MRLKPVEEQVVALMGASSGIGREAALRLARRGARVVVSGRDEEGLGSLVQEIRGSGGEATAVPAEVTEFDEVKAVADRAAAEYGRLDTWIHLAGVSVFSRFEDMTPEEFRRVVEVDLVGQAYGAMAALPHLRREGRGALVHISSVLGRRSVPLQSAYCASKHGVEGLVESLRLELKHEGLDIGVTSVMPASINTPFFDKARTRLGVKPMSFPPFYEPGLVAEAILYAAENAPRDLFVGGAGKAMILNQRLSPRLMDVFMAGAGFKYQQTDEPKTAEDPDGLFDALPSQARVEGDFGKLSLPKSLQLWLDTRPVLRRGLFAGAALGTLTLLKARS